MDPGPPRSTIQSGDIGKMTFRLVVCIAVVLAIVTFLASTPVPYRALTAALIFLLMVLVVSAVWGFRYAVFVSVLGALGFSWLVPPVGSFKISDWRDLFALVAFLIVGMIGSYLSERARKEALNANLRRAEAVAEQQRFRDLVNSVEGIVWEADAESFAFTFVSDQAERVLGYPPEQWLREPAFWKDHLHPADRGWAIEACRQATEQKRSHDFEYRMIAADGRYVWMRDLVTAVSENGRPTQLRGVMVDVTKRKQNEEALREHAKLLDLTHDAVLVRDMNRTIAYWNRGAEELYGWPADEANGQVPYDLLRTVFPKPLEEIEAEVMRTGRWEGELVQTRKNRTTVVVASRWSLQRDDKGTPIAILVTNNDISEAKRAEQARKEIEEQWRAAFESNPTMYFIVDEAGQIVSVNTFGADQLGYTVDELVGQPVLNVFYEPDRTAVQEHANSCFQQPGRMMRWEARIIRKDGTMIWVRETANAVFLKNRLMLLVVCEDITEQKRATDTLRRTEAILSQAQRIARIGVWVTRSPMIPEYWSPTAFEIFGIDPAKGPPQNAEEFMLHVHPEDRERVLRDTDVLETGRVFECKYRIVRPDGATRVIREVGSPVQENSAVQRFVGAWMDITEQDEMTRELQRREAALQDSEEQWRAAFESNPIMYFMVDAAGGIVSVNTFGAEQLGYTVDELVGQPVLSVFYEPDRAPVQEHANSCFQQPGQMMRWEARKIRKDGAMIWVRETANAVFLKNRPILLVICEDITEQKRAEEAARRSENELRDVIETIPAMAFAIRPDGSTDFVNRRVLEFTGLSGDTISGPGWQSTIHPDDFDRHMNKWRAAMASGQPFENELRHRSASGEYRWFLVRAVPLCDEHGNILKWYGVLTDIEDRKRAEEALRRSETYLAEAQRLSKTGSWVFRPGTPRATYWSEEMFRIWGFDPRQGPPDNQAAWQRIHPEDLKASLQEQIDQASSGSFKVDLLNEFRIVLPDGTMKYLQGTSHPVFDEAGNVVEYVGTSMDITERKYAEDALRRSEAYLAEAQRLSHIGSWAGNLITQQVFHSSDEHLRLYGFDPSQHVPSFEEFYHRILPEDEPVARASLASAVRAGTDFDFEFRILCPDGTVKDTRTIGHPALSGQPGEYTGISIDITERKRAEKELRDAEMRFRTFVDHATDAFLVHDEQGNIVDVNRQACESLGYTREELIGSSPGIFDPRADVAFHQWVREQLESGGICAFESSHRRKDGTVFPVEVRLRPFMHGGQQFALALVRDITDAKRAEQESERLRRVEEEIARINRVTTMGELTASVAHEINQPIAAAVTNANTSVRWLNKENPNVDEARDAAKRAAKDALRAAEIIHRIRSLFRKGEAHREAVDLNEIIHEMIVLLRNEAMLHGISIQSELSADLPHVMADRIQLQQVLMNLMLNSIEAMKGVDGKRELTLVSQRNGGGEVLISVSDNGVGLPTDTAQIFDAFFTTKTHGTGMGLAISRTIIESHGGRLWASSNSGRGATFYFTLPAPVEAQV